MKDKFKLTEVPGGRGPIYEYFKSNHIDIESLPKLDFKYLNFSFKAYVSNLQKNTQFQQLIK